MRILRVRRGFQADHSSSSYLFYAVDQPLSAEDQAIAHRYSSRAEVEDRTVRYHKWGDSSLDSRAYEALLGAHCDVMVSESYDWWTFMIALPKTPEMQALLAPFTEALGYDDQGVEIEDYGKRLVVVVYCAFKGNGVEFASDDNEDALETLVDLLVKIRAELKGGDTSFLEAVVSFYGGDEPDEDEDDDEPAATSPTAALETLSKGELQQECKARGIAFRKSWTKAQLCDALLAAASTPPGVRPKGRRSRLSQAAQKIVSQLR